MCVCLCVCVCVCCVCVFEVFSIIYKIIIHTFNFNIIKFTKYIIDYLIINNYEI